jgi:hypothetical protein
MATYYDDNYGFYEIRDQDDIDFYHETQKASVWKKCHGCGKRVKIKPGLRLLQQLRRRTGERDGYLT